MNETSSGAFCSNDSVLQSMMVDLPFGGVGEFLPRRSSLICRDEWERRLCQANEGTGNASTLPYISSSSHSPPPDRCEWDGLLSRTEKLRHLLPPQVLPAERHPVRGRHISALPTLRGPQSASHDLGQRSVPEEPGLVPAPVRRCRRGGVRG